VQKCQEIDMYDVMEGVKVVEVAEHTFVPAAAMVLADWGADVIKIERTTSGGDPGRSLAIPNSGRDGMNMYFEAGNRGKRSVALDLTRPEGREMLYKLVASADVFVTNLRADARKKLSIEPADLMAANPRLIYARGTGYGLRGRMANDGGFDFPSSWCRSGSGYMQTIPGGEPPNQPGSIGDLGGGAVLAGAIAAALFRRERTGKGAVVDNALYLFGTYLMSQSVIAASIGLKRGPNAPRSEAFNAIVNLYRTRDNRWLYLCLLMDRWWSNFATVLGRPDLLENPLYVDAAARYANRKALIAELDAVFAAEDYDYWVEKLRPLEGVWAPLQSPEDVIADPQALENGFVTPVAGNGGPGYLASASPAQFDEQPIGTLQASPVYAAHTDAVMKEIGLSDDQIKTLRSAGVVL
jgi:crotonobetainyl-CoA:carnitine CoA-transferase CaiB-like acyl-CoA transferase